MQPGSTANAAVSSASEQGFQIEITRRNFPGTATQSYRTFVDQVLQEQLHAFAAQVKEVAK